MKKSLLVPAKVTVLSLPELIGVFFVKTVIYVTSIFGGGAGSSGMGGRQEEINGRNVVMLTRTKRDYNSTVLYFVSGFLDDQDRAIVRKITEFLETKAIVESTVSCDAEAFQVFSGKDLGPEIKVEDLSKAELGDIDEICLNFR